MRKFKFRMVPTKVVETEEVFEFEDNVSSNDINSQLVEWSLSQFFNAWYKEIKNDERHIEKIEIYNGKYEVVHEIESGKTQFYANKCGEKWKDLTGDNLIYAMFCRIQELEAELKKTTQTN